MAWLFRRAPGTEADDREEQERRAAALVTMRDLCKDLLESPQVGLAFCLAHIMSMSEPPPNPLA